MAAAAQNGEVHRVLVSEKLWIAPMMDMEEKIGVANLTLTPRAL
jgi:hypothetical protein